MIGCTHFHYPARQNLIRPGNTSFFNGYYKNVSPDTLTISMWRVLSMADRYKKPITKYDKQNAYVQLTGKTNRSIDAKLFIDTTLIGERSFHGKIKGDYFVTRRKLRYRGLPFIIGTEADCKLQFSKDSSNNIYIDDAFSTMGWVFIMFAGTDAHNNYKYMPK